MALDLSKVGNRERLKVQREPHWQRLRAGCFLGFRPSKRGGKGTWIARVYDEDASRYQVKSLGDFGTLPGNEMFAAAKKEAEKLAELVESGGERPCRGNRSACVGQRMRLGPILVSSSIQLPDWGSMNLRQLMLFSLH